jgi:hypothetical protein
MPAPITPRVIGFWQVAFRIPATPGSSQTADMTAWLAWGLWWARGIDPKVIARVLGDFVETDQRLCKRIGVEPQIGAAAMAMLWRLTFTAERDRRAGDDANAQRRGQISRGLQAELEKRITDGDD